MTGPDFTAKRHPLPAAIAAGVFLVLATLVGVTSGVIGVVYMQGVTMQSLDGFEYALPAFGQALPHTLGLMVPVAIGLFLSLWLIAPLRFGMGLGAAIGRTFLALVVGLILSVLVQAFLVLGQNQLALNPGGGEQPDDRLYLLIGGGLLNTAWTLFADTLGLALAAGLGAWGWLRTRVPALSDESVSA
ncbi:hypothetical protein EYE40_01805 [Glaciihabitans arcticus]|uniref:Uncharacterized protein n=1 Tax=Glaciihabitans arcticus TaxID=2668039 RepID=A0A4Q9GVM4_9MICO|nr:hypothetical protein [Glaciihabitans arcticus]TBN56230.1 hypothetical protein EYE40_01805 [Glaciihabitans arcticus]